MSLFHETVLRTYAYGQHPSSGSLLTLVEGEWSGERQLGLGFPNHPQVIVPKAALLAAPSMRAWLDELALSPENEADLQALIAQVEPQLDMTAEVGYLWVSLLAKGNAAGQGAYDPRERLVFWLIAELQSAARGEIQDAEPEQVAQLQPRVCL